LINKHNGDESPYAWSRQMSTTKNPETIACEVNDQNNVDLFHKQGVSNMQKTCA